MIWLELKKVPSLLSDLDAGNQHLFSDTYHEDGTCCISFVSSNKITDHDDLKVSIKYTKNTILHYTLDITNKIKKINE